MRKKRIQRFYIDRIIEGEDHIEIHDEQYHYINRVLRLQVGDQMIIFDKSGSEWMTRISDTKKNRLVIQLKEKTSPDRESPINITLIQSISRSQRMDAVMQKSTELGVNKIVPVFSKNTTIKIDETKLDKKMQHWRKILISASEQSGRTKIPELSTPVKFDSDCLKKFKSELSVFFDTTGKQSFDGMKPNSITIAIGPEGGFNEDEKNLASKHGYSVVRSGPRLLRTETAPIMALSILQYLYGDLSN